MSYETDASIAAAEYYKKHLNDMLNAVQKATDEFLDAPGNKIKEVAENIKEDEEKRVKTYQENQKQLNQMQIAQQENSQKNIEGRAQFAEEVIKQQLKDFTLTEGVQYVIDKALINCTYSGVDNKDLDNLSILKVKGHECVYASEDVMMHDRNCIPIENIEFKFKKCEAPNYDELTTEIFQKLIHQQTVFDKSKSGGVNPGQTELEKYQGLMVKKGPNGVHPCIYPLVDRWFDADEKIDINLFFDHLYAAYTLMEVTIDNLKKWMQKITYALSNVQSLFIQDGNLWNNSNYLNEVGQLLPVENSGDLSALQSIAKRMQSKILNNFDVILKELSDCTLNFGSGEDLKAHVPKFIQKLTVMKSKLWTGKTYTNFNLLQASISQGLTHQGIEVKFGNEVDVFLDVAQPGLIMLVQRKMVSEKELNDWFGQGTSWYNDALDRIIEEFNKLLLILEEKPNNPILKTSFLVCRLGGTLTVQDAGQWYSYAKIMIRPNLRIMLYDISEFVFGTRGAGGEYGIGGALAQSKIDLKVGYDSGDEIAKTTFSRKIEFFEYLRICLKIMEEAAALPKGATPTNKQCPLYVKVTVYPQNVLDDEQRERNAKMGFAATIANVVALLAVGTPVGAFAIGCGIGLSLLGMALDFQEEAWGAGDNMNALDLGLQGANIATSTLKDSKVAAELLLSKGLDVGSPIFSKANALYTFAVACDLAFQKASDREYPGKIDIEFIGVKQGCLFSQKYNKAAECSGPLEFTPESNETYYHAQKIYGLQPGLYTDLEDISKLHPEIQLISSEEED